MNLVCAECGYQAKGPQGLTAHARRHVRAVRPCGCTVGARHGRACTDPSLATARPTIVVDPLSREMWELRRAIAAVLDELKGILLRVADVDARMRHITSGAASNAIRGDRSAVA